MNKDNIIVWVMVSFTLLLLSSQVYAAEGDKENGKKVYEKRCAWCHGWQGAGDGPSAPFLNPPPRDFTSGMYKFKTTQFDELIPTDEDIFRMITDGMPDSSMPGWKDILSDKGRWDLVAYIKTFAGLEGKPSKQIDLSKRVKSSSEGLVKGKELFKDRCSECHGEDGKGDANKKLKDDWGARTWPRNLTKAWTFRASNGPNDIYARVTAGIPGTQMPSFADPASKKKMTDEERWHVANYVTTLADKKKEIKEGETVLKARRIDDALPDKPDDPRWGEAEPTNFYLVPQIIGGERFFTPTVNSITARAFYNDKEIAILLEWDDRTKSIPGEEKAKDLADGEVLEDAVALQFPLTIPEEMEKPYFGMGDSTKPVSIWFWKSERLVPAGSNQGKDTPQTAKLLNASGFKKIEEKDTRKAGLTSVGVYNKGTWRVVMKRPLTTGESDIQVEEGKFIPIAFAIWDGTNGEKGSKYTMTTWYWLFLKPSAGMKVYVIPLIVAIAIFGGELFLVRKRS
ncbi:MAG: c-type cytochrome [Deltaproteobacteria bacterium]|nr:c-type cytochrome [Deltaproteobacteria bacterium]